MRRAVFGSEVGARFAPGFGALHEIRPSRVRFRLGRPGLIAAGGMAVLIAVAAIGHMH
jgi:hypothetical protein